MNHYAIIVPARQAKKETLCSLQREEEIGKKTVFKMSSGISVLWSLFPVAQLEVGHTEFLFSRLSVVSMRRRTHSVNCSCVSVTEC